MDDKIIPFGKHKGKPVEILAADKQYTEWLLAQSWFKKDHINLYNVVINNFREPVDTPEHNKLQIKFLKQEYRLKFAYLANKNLFENDSAKINLGIRKILDKTERRENEYFLEALKNPNENNHVGLYTKALLEFTVPIFEHVDVKYSLSYGLQFHYENNHPSGHWSTFRYKRRSTYFIEIKPTVSDDYPAILRQMKASMPIERGYDINDNFYVLLIDKYTGTGATQEEFIEYFETQGYKVIFETDVQEFVLPDFDKVFALDSDLANVISKSI